MTPEEAAKQRKVDEAATAVADVYPRLCGNLYKEFQENGFTPDQAFSLVQSFWNTNVTMGLAMGLRTPSPPNSSSSGWQE